MNLLVKNIIRQKLLEMPKFGTKTNRKSTKMKHPVMFHRIGKEYGWSDMRKGVDTPRLSAEVILDCGYLSQA